MSAEALAGRPTAAPPRRAASRTAPLVSERFDPDLFEEAPPDDPGRLHAAWTLAEMIRSAARDALALADGPASAAMFGCAEGWLAIQVLDWGFATVLAVDPDERRRRDLIRWGEFLCIEPGRLSAVEAAPMEGDGRDLAIVDLRCLPGDPAEGLAMALTQARHHVIVTADPNAAADAAVTAGHPVPKAVGVPADGERRFIDEEIVVLGGSRADER